MSLTGMHCIQKLCIAIQCLTTISIGNHINASAIFVSINHELHEKFMRFFVYMFDKILSIACDCTLNWFPKMQTSLFEPISHYIVCHKTDVTKDYKA
jgi:hypothetical protein